MVQEAYAAKRQEMSLDTLVVPSTTLPRASDGDGDEGRSATLDALVLQYMRLHEELDKHMQQLEAAQREVGACCADERLPSERRR